MPVGTVFYRGIGIECVWPYYSSVSLSSLHNLMLIETQLTIAQSFSLLPYSSALFERYHSNSTMSISRQWRVIQIPVCYGYLRYQWLPEICAGNIQRTAVYSEWHVSVIYVETQLKWKKRDFRKETTYWRKTPSQPWRYNWQKKLDCTHWYS